MARVQLALNVPDVAEAVGFYTTLFGTSPAKLRPGYANFAVADPPLKLVLIEAGDASPHTFNHLGVEVGDPEEVEAASRRLAEAGLETTDERATSCCYAVQDKVWVSDPDDAPWEIYTVLADAPVESGIAGDGACCGLAAAAGSEAGLAVASPSRCC